MVFLDWAKALASLPHQSIRKGLMRKGFHRLLQKDERRCITTQQQGSALEVKKQDVSISIPK